MIDDNNICDTYGNVVLRYHYAVTTANHTLIADAPLLLEEVERLLRVLEDIESMIPDNHEEVSPILSDILNECHRVLPTFNEVIE